MLESAFLDDTKEKILDSEEPAAWMDVQICLKIDVRATIPNPCVSNDGPVLRDDDPRILRVIEARERPVSA